MTGPDGERRLGADLPFLEFSVVFWALGTRMFVNGLNYKSPLVRLCIR